MMSEYYKSFLIGLPLTDLVEHYLSLRFKNVYQDSKEGMVALIQEEDPEGLKDSCFDRDLYL